MVGGFVAGHEHHAYGQSHHSTHEAHPLDDCLGFGHEPRVHYTWVGHCKGRYRERRPGSGVFDYVGPHRGDHEKEQLPPDHTMRYLGICCCLMILSLVAVVAVKALLEDPPFDCQVALNNWEAAWSLMKKEWCCENRNLGCEGDPNLMTTTTPPEFPTEPPIVEQPRWLRMWLADMDVGAKFIMTMVLALIVGCCCGGFLLYIAVRYYIPPKKSKTELELMAEVNNLLTLSNCDTRGELQVSLAWDAHVDLDLHLVLPDGREISAEPGHQEYHGGRLAADEQGVELKKKNKWFIEHIYWGPYNPAEKLLNPPEGEYQIWVEVPYRHVLHADVNLTIVKTIHGQREVFHHRLVPGVFKKHLCNFKYWGPDKRHHPQGDAGVPAHGYSSQHDYRHP
jgi:hypothetical protein